MMALCAGILFFSASLLAPRQGVLIRLIRHRRLALRILSEDLIALLYRIDERQTGCTTSISKLRSVLFSGSWVTSFLMQQHLRRGHVLANSEGFQLTDSGRRLGAELVRSHRLWEQYLVSEAGVAMDRIHDQAEKLEHFTGRDMRDRLEQETSAPATDPHGSPIPPE
jgi:manganese/zinc/iron transport system permease protein